MEGLDSKQAEQIDGFFKSMDSGNDFGKETPVEKQVETPLQASPPTEPPAEPEKEVKSEFNIKDHFPEYDDLDQVKGALSKLKTVPSDDEITGWKSRAEQFDKHNQFIETLRNVGLNNDYLRLQILEAQKSEKADTFKKILWGAVSDTELVKMDLLDKYPELKEDQEMLDYQLEKKYPHIFGPDADPESDEYAKAKKDMKFEANQVKKRLKGEFDSVELPDILNPDYTKNQQVKTLETWKPHFESHSEEFSTVNVDVEGSKDAFMSIKIPEKLQKDYKNAALMFIANNGLTYGKEALQKVKDFVGALYITQNKAAYNKAILDKRAAMSDEQWRKFIHNPKPNESGKAVQAKVADEVDEFFKKLGR